MKVLERYAPYIWQKMCCIYFMSDDADAKYLANNFFSSKSNVSVKTLFDALVMCKEKDTKLKWKDINPTVTNVMRKRKNKVEQLKRLYA